jgi:hypothetical protein
MRSCRCSLGLLLMLHPLVGSSAQSSVATGENTVEPAAHDSYFPDGVFHAREPKANVIENYFAGYLHKMAEPSLLQEASSNKSASYRLTRISPLGTQLVVRLNIIDMGAAKLTTKIASGEGLPISESHRDVSSDEIDEFLKTVTNSDFWSAPSAEPPQALEPMDGQIWLIEGRGPRGYHAVLRSNPKPSPYTEIGRLLAKKLGKLDDSVIAVPAYNPKVCCSDRKSNN